MKTTVTCGCGLRATARSNEVRLVLALRHVDGHYAFAGAKKSILFDCPAGHELSVDVGEADDDLIHAAFEAVEADAALNAPYVCPGCHAVGEAPCSPDCSDAAMERERQDRETAGILEEDSWDEMDENLVPDSARFGG
jgi:hypothetical protein